MKKKLVPTVIVAIIVFSLIALSNVKAIKDARDEAIFRHVYVSRMSNDPAVLAKFLLATGNLDEFSEVDENDHSETIKNCMAVFSENEEIHREALERAKELFSEIHIDCNWEEVRKLDEPTPILPPATIAETGETISEKAAGFWIPPEDFN